MPPRIRVAQCLRAQSTQPQHSSSRAFSSTPASHASTVAQRRKHRDPYALAQANAKKAANLSRQEVLRVERASKLGDPVRGVTTPFVQSFDTALPPQAATAADVKTDTDNHLNFFLSKDELEESLADSEWLTKPLPTDPYPSLFDTPPTSKKAQSSSYPKGIDQGLSNSLMDIMNSFPEETAGQRDEWADSSRNVFKKTTPEERDQIVREQQATAEEALRRISSLSLGSSADRLRINKQRCIDVFGRHNTDQSLPPKAKAANANNQLEKEERVGPDTGSSEVQIAILTAKIRALADFLETRGATDKHGKRDLRLLVHRRAKLLKYLRKKERGGPRWQHLIETLGLTDGTWQGEITM